MECQELVETVEAVLRLVEARTHSHLHSPRSRLTHRANTVSRLTLIIMYVSVMLYSTSDSLYRSYSVFYTLYLPVNNFSWIFDLFDGFLFNSFPIFFQYVLSLFLL